ncbi:DUF6602 domain-containing protein [Mycolicibacterium pyrenivorans]|uniref:DUF6602 domain-containing protein n=1 Tax=Mycolicibacterium pyrenivorans TaxID=187102 RepID=UPI0021F2BD3D|nr:DUF6602 domain-containing protein [Mycolicibacterium pyrenivorans]MCV7154349.1 hypothetical protein [Mycolicibacterium pyrenivorans]
MGKEKKSAARETVNVRTGLRFETILANAEQALKLELDRARLESDHSLTIGEQAEAAVRDTLRGALPAGYGVGHGHVYDAYGDKSRQTDVVITNLDHPLSFPHERAGTYLVDGVSAAGEVKATLTPHKLEDCLQKGAKFKQLRMTLNKGDFVGTVGQQVQIMEMGLVPGYFVIAFASKMKVDSVSERLQEAGLIPPPEGKTDGPKDDGNAPQPPLDAICVLGQGVYFYIRPNNPMGLHYVEHPDQSGWIFLPTDAPLAWTLTWLHAAMPRVWRGRSVFAPYLIPNRKNLRYMASRGYINVTEKQDEQGET